MKIKLSRRAATILSVLLAILIVTVIVIAAFTEMRGGRGGRTGDLAYNAEDTDIITGESVSVYETEESVKDRFPGEQSYLEECIAMPGIVISHCCTLQTM